MKEVSNRKQANRGGRPSKMESEKASKHCVFHLTKDEFDGLNRLKPKGISFSKFYRQLVLSRKSRVVFSEDQSQLILSVDRIGNNLNQIARRVNTLNLLGESDKQVLFEKLDELKEVIGQLYSGIVKGK